MVKKYLMAAFLWYIRFLAKLQLRKHTPLIIGITGSTGKTSSLNAIEAVLKALPHTKVRVSHKANSELGLPLHILGITTQDFRFQAWLKIAFLALWKLLTSWEKTDISVAEMGIDSPFPPQNMEYLLSFLHPDIGVFLNVHAVHTEAFDPVVSQHNPEKRAQALIQAIANEKGKLITQLPSQGVAILNSDDVAVAPFSKQTKAVVLDFGTSPSAFVRLKEWKPSIRGTTFSFQIQGQTVVVSFPNFLFPQHFGYSFASALAVVKVVAVPLEAALASLAKNFSLPPGRSTLIEGIRNSLIIDSSYNASLRPMLDMLELLHTVKPKRSIAVLGDMREMGSQTEKAHEKVARKAAEVADMIVLIGPFMKQYALPLLSQKKTHWFANAFQAAEFLTQKVQTGDCILVKGSQNTLLLEIIVEKLMAHPEQAESLLCRRGEYWEIQRQKIPQE